MSANPDDISLYETDFDRWVHEQLALLRERRYHELDIDNLREEIEDLARRDRQALKSRLAILIMHLLKWQYQPHYPGKSSWRATINEQRLQIEVLLEDSPSLKRYMSEQLARTFDLAVRVAMSETGLPRATFPDQCPYTVEQLRDLMFFPDSSDG